MQGNDQFIVRTPDNREVTFYTNPQTRYTINNNAGRYSDLRVGSTITTNYAVQGDRYYANAVTVGAVTTTPNQAVEQPVQPAQPVGQATVVEGTVVRVVGQDQVVLRTADNKEVIVYVAPQTKYVINEQPAQFTQYQTGMPIRVEYDVRDRRNVARGIFGRPLRNK